MHRIIRAASVVDVTVHLKSERLDLNLSIKLGSIQGEVKDLWDGKEPKEVVASLTSALPESDDWRFMTADEVVAYKRELAEEEERDREIERGDFNDEDE